MKLEDVNKDNIFKVPEGYFEEFPDRLRKKIDDAGHSRRIPVIRIQPIIHMVAAAVILMFVIYGIRQLGQQSNTADQLLSNISTEELINYLEETDISAEELLESLDVSLITLEDFSGGDDLFPSETIDDETIDDLLNEYEIELQYL